MPLRFDEIRSNAHEFARKWKDAHSEDADAKSFWDAFFTVFGVDRRLVASFEVRTADGKIDMLWKRTLIVEHKSRGKNLDRAYRQALDYFPGIKQSDLPRYVLVCDFARFRLHDLDKDTRLDFGIEDLHKNVDHLAFIAGYQVQELREQDPVNIQAAEKMGGLHDELKESGYAGHELEVYLVRLLFCMFAESTGIFNRQQFQFYLEDRTAEDGSDLGARIDALFDVLNTPPEKRQAHLDGQLVKFEHINGDLFAENLRQAHFSRKMRGQLLECCKLDWSGISPAIFGSLFQSIMDKEARRYLGAHYTSEKNILKLINPLFMDELRAEFESVKRSKAKLNEFHKKLAALTFLDPACGCGNFLVIAYRELRMLETDVLKLLYQPGKQAFDIKEIVKVNVDQFYGIEIEEFPAQIAQVAMWLVDHQMNVQASAEFGAYFARIPLTTSANIVHGNALRKDWAEVAPGMNYIMGNPPFAGQRHRSADKTADMLACYRNKKGAGMVDYVSAWYVKSVEYMAGTGIKAAFVSTNSLAQGVQVAPFWNELRSRDSVHIHFAHRTFQWSNEARGKAAVQCIIIGFALHEAKVKRLFEYENVDGEPQEIRASNINPYLVDGPNMLVQSRGTPLCKVTPLLRGSDAVDGGHFLFDESEMQEFLKREPQAKLWIRRYLSGKSFLHNQPRYCLWLVDCPPDKLRAMPLVMQRVQAVKKVRMASRSGPTKEAANTPTLFFGLRKSSSKFLFVPKITSETRTYIPTAFFGPEAICAGPHFQMPNASLYDFAVFTSLMHMAWMRLVTGRMKSDYNYSVRTAYNNFVWPENPTDAQISAIETAAQTVLDARAESPDSTLADLYDPDRMPLALLRAHQKVDTAVDRAYRKQPFQNEAARVSFLFELYRQHTAPVMPPARKKRARKKKAA